MKVIFVLILIASPLAQATEQAQALVLCQEIMAMYSKQHGGDDMSSICQYNVNGIEVLRCTRDRMRTGETFEYVSERCGMGK